MTRAGRVVEIVARALADRPDEVHVSETERRGSAIVEVSLAPDDLGRLIGRQGRTVAALRTLASAAAEMDGLKAAVEVRDEGGARRPRHSRR